MFLYAKSRRRGGARMRRRRKGGGWTPDKKERGIHRPFRTIDTRKSSVDETHYWLRSWTKAWFYTRASSWLSSNPGFRRRRLSIDKRPPRLTLNHSRQDEDRRQRRDRQGIPQLPRARRHARGYRAAGLGRWIWNKIGGTIGENGFEKGLARERERETKASIYLSLTKVLFEYSFGNWWIFG